MRYDSFDIEVKMILLENMVYRRNDIHHLIDNIINGFLTLAEVSSDTEGAMKEAAEYIFAYIRMGFSYLEHKQLFDLILTKAGCSISEIDEMHSKNSIVVANKSQIRGIIGRWRASPYNSHTITNAVNEIVYNVVHDCIGTYKYYTERKSGYKAYYVLTISADYALFHDVNCNRFYRIIKPIGNKKDAKISRSD